ncbi:MAG: hypothetical protein HC860_10305 [Alkalinema sp. RU_4_3]|nr:hypothetical protein [Alkalinema sp. RU_4_3]
MSLPETVTEYQPELIVRSDYFGYEPVEDQQRIEWYLNFAHSDLFCAYGGSLFAQDEMQVAEHPALASLREALLAQNISALTVEAGNPTPILIRGVERRCAIATDPSSSLGRPYGLYGNNFARAKADVIQQATQVINPPTMTNIIAIEAPVGGYGSYTLDEIRYVLTTAFTGFAAACVESELAQPQSSTVIHTGFWGCGAYGGNRVLMVLLQLLAARLAGVTWLIFHTGAADANQPLSEAQGILQRLLGSVDRSLDDTLVAIQALDFQWGVGDGN